MPNSMTGLKPRIRPQRTDSVNTTPVSREESRTEGTAPASSLTSPSVSWRPETSAKDGSTTRQDLQTPESASDAWRPGLVPETFINGSPSRPRSAPADQNNDWVPRGLARSGQGPTSGYLGSTSFSAVFDENHNKIGIVSVDENSGITETQIECLSSREHESKIKAGVAVLAELADFKHLNALTSRWLVSLSVPG